MFAVVQVFAQLGIVTGSRSQPLPQARENLVGPDRIQPLLTCLSDHSLRELAIDTSDRAAGPCSLQTGVSCPGSIIVPPLLAVPSAQPLGSAPIHRATGAPLLGGHVSFGP